MNSSIGVYFKEIFDAYDPLGSLARRLCQKQLFYRSLQCLLGRYVSKKQNGACGCVIKTPLLFYVLYMWIFVPNSPLESSANDSAKAKYTFHPLTALNIFIRNGYQKYDRTSAFGDRGINVTSHGVTSVCLRILFSTIYITVPRNLLKFSLKAGKH